MKTIRLNPELLGEKIVKLKEFIKSKVLHQDEALEKIAKAISFGMSPLKDPNLPVGVFLLAGPSGVGKTMTAEIVAEYLLGSQLAIVKIDCTEIKSPHDISSLIGSPAGYVGYYDPKNSLHSGTIPPRLSQESINSYAQKMIEKKLSNDPEVKKLNAEITRLKIEFVKIPSNDKQTKEDAAKKIEDITERLNIYRQVMATFQKKYSIILFDEIEKANKVVQEILLNIVDRGKIAMANGLTTSFADSIIFMTTNASSKELADTLSGKNKVGFNTGNDTKNLSRITMERIGKCFLPEFIGRIKNNIIVFQPIVGEKLLDIINVEIKYVSDRFKESAKITICVDEKIKKLIMNEASLFPEYGARLSKQKIEECIAGPIGLMIISGQIRQYDRIFAKMEDEKIVFEKMHGELVKK